MEFFRRPIAAILLLSLACLAPLSAVEKVSRTPYLGAIVVDDATGQVLFEDNADAPGYPASVTKLMTFLVIMDRVKAGQLTLETPITVSAEASRTGGSQVYLKQGEVFTVDDLLYALMIQSANDAAVALATHAAGSKEAFVALMNAKARQIGMTHTTFQSPHGLPPGKGQQVDITTARDLALLSRELIDHDDVLRYSSVKVRMLRGNTANPFEMRNHNHLLGKLAGCDGLKTGYFSAAGYSLSATAIRDGRRIIVVVLGSEASKTRDFKVMELMEKGFASLPAMPTVNTAAKPAVAAPATAGKPATRAEPTVRTEPASAAPASTSAEPAVTFRVIPPSSTKKP
jgi:D-alanyl-D-alanine carboxypeptidase (penicillin-binding protein 5/6)